MDKTTINCINIILHGSEINKKQSNTKNDDELILN